MTKIGIIGGSGLDDPNLLDESAKVECETPYGIPSSLLTMGKLNNVDVVILSRHGFGHIIPPTKVNNKANIQSLKEAGCTHILATTAVGSLKEEIDRGDLVILDQFIDFTRHRAITFHDDFKQGPKHTPMANPFDESLRNLLIESCNSLNYKNHPNGTVITIEGPRFSTKAESKMFQSWGADVINMSIAPEATLANELGIPYAAIAMSTDFDSWRDEQVTWESILEVINKNVEKVKKLILETIPKIK